MNRSRVVLHGLRAAGSVTAVAFLVAAALPLPIASAAGPRAGVGAATSPGSEPSIAYDQAMEHANDKIVFEPGGRVSVGFSPRSDDRWSVDGRAPAALPAGRATGRQMDVSPEGSVWTDISTSGAPSGAGGRPAPRPIVVPGIRAPEMELAGADAPVDSPGNDSGGVPGWDTAVSAGWTTPLTGTPSQPEAASGLRRQVFGFLPYWELSGASRKLNYDVLSTIAYFSVGADAKGNLRKRDPDGTSSTGWGGWNSSSMTSVINAAHAHGTRVVLTISVFAWSSSQASVQRALLGSPAARRNLARQAAAAVRDRGADGVNLDFEPLASGYADEFVSLLRTFRSELNRVRSGYQLTYDTTGYIGNYPLEASVAAGAADAIFIMGYDYRTAGSGTAGSIDPLSGPGYDLADTVRSYTARVSPSKVILGIPWYGRAWSTVSGSARAATRSGLKYGYSTAVNYENVTSLVAKYGRKWDPVEQSPYVAYRRQNCTRTYGCVTSWRQVYYDDGQSTKLRLALVNDYRLRGAGLWALGYDGGHAELYRAIAESFLVDKAAPQAGIRLLDSRQTDEGFVVSWTARDVSRIASYDVQVSTDGGSWMRWLAGTKATSDVYPGVDGHGYAFRVRARDSKGNNGAWVVTSGWKASPSLRSGGFGRVTKDGLSYRAGPHTSSARLGSIAAGTIVALTRGPVSADGYTWFEVTQPVKDWSPVSFVERGVWIATSKGSTSYVRAYRAPNSTTVDAGIVGFDFGTGGSAVGTSTQGVNARTFSPGKDGSRDGLRLRWRNSVAMRSMSLRVYRTNGTLVGTVKVNALAAGSRAWTWNGMVNGVRVRDGRYMLQLQGKAAGRTYSAPSARPVTTVQVAAYGITVDTAAPMITAASASGKLLSPNGDGTLDSVKLSMTSRGATSWTLSIVAAGGAPVRAASGKGGAFSFTWKGTDGNGKRVPDGRYTATLSAWDVAGNHAARSFPITVDTKGPVVNRTASRAAFSPDGDGTADTAALSWTASEQSTGTSRLYRGSTLVRSWSVSRVTSWSTTWNGRTASGAAVPEGTYTFRVSVKDPAGNRGSASGSVVVDRTASRLRWSRAFYPQDGDALLPTAALTWTLTRKATTTLRLYDAKGLLVRTVWSGKSQGAGTRRWTWDGRLADGTRAPQGSYTARLVVRSSLSTQTLARAVWAAAFAVSPSATTVRPGQRLTVRFTSVEPLSSRPVVTFTQPGRTGAKVSATKLADGSYRASFTVATGKPGAGSVRISAKDAGGRTNSTTVAIAIAR